MSVEAARRRHHLRRVWAAFFRHWDVLLCPVFGRPALSHMQTGETSERIVVLDGRTIRYNDLLFWPGITGAFHLPATVAPLGMSREGLPIGVQIVGPYGGDLTTIAMAHLLEQSWRGFSAPAGMG